MILPPQSHSRKRFPSFFKASNGLAVGQFRIRRKTPITIRLDPDIVEHYKATGKGWQSRMNDDLRKAAGL